MMKNFTQILTIILTIAVAVLFYLQFSKPKIVAAPVQASQTGFKIAYFEPDSLQNRYEYYKGIISSLESKQQNYAKQMDQYRRNLQSKAEAFQQKYQSLSQAELAAKQNEIAANQKELADLDNEAKSKEQSLGQDLQDEKFKKLQEVKKEIETFLKEYNKTKGYAYILSGAPDLMYYKDSAYNITEDLIKGLNEMHKNKK